MGPRRGAGRPITIPRAPPLDRGRRVGWGGVVLVAYPVTRRGVGRAKLVGAPRSVGGVPPIRQPCGCIAAVG